tara:strand:- start:220 stop:855 length:636 start_codon:yes stop_codon:yes gene_type:complete
MSKAYFVLQGLKSFATFISNRRANKVYLQKLHTDKLLNQNQALTDINDREESRLITQANNEVWASSAGYDPFDSGSFKAIADNVDQKADEDIERINLGMKITDDSINASLKNLNFQMRLNEVMLATDLAGAGMGYNNYLKDQRYLDMQRKIEIKKAQLAKNKIKYSDSYSYRKGGFYKPRDGKKYVPYKGPSMAQKNLWAYNRTRTKGNQP